MSAETPRKPPVDAASPPPTLVEVEALVRAYHAPREVFAQHAPQPPGAQA